MDTILDYVKNETRDFNEYPFHVADAMVFAMLSYDSIPKGVPTVAELQQKYGTFSSRVKQFDSHHPFRSVKTWWKVPFDGVDLRRVEEEVVTREANERTSGFTDPKLTQRFCRTAGFNPRFGVCEMSAADEQFDTTKLTQFAAMTFRLPTDTLVIAFRGTDDSLVGWREDFNMIFQYPVPAQREAAAYLDAVAKLWPGRLVLTGHSKGGNLAIYAAMNARDEVKDRIEQIYSFDGPGFQESVINSYEYSTIVDRITKVVPQFSIIGMLLKDPADERRIVVKPTVDNLMQHSCFKWQMQGDRLVTVPDVDESSKEFNAAINEWLAGMNQRQREQAVHALFSVLESAGRSTVSELMNGGFGVLPNLLGTYVGLDGEGRKYLNQSVRILITALLNHSSGHEAHESHTDRDAARDTDRDNDSSVESHDDRHGDAHDDSAEKNDADIEKEKPVHSAE